MITFARRVQGEGLSKQFLRFIAGGLVNTALSYAVYVAALFLGAQFAVASLISLLAGVVIGFRIHGKFVFNRLEYRLFWRYLSLWLLIYCANIAFIKQMMNFGFDAYAAGAIALPFIVIVSFIIQKFLVFQDRKSKSAQASN